MRTVDPLPGSERDRGDRRPFVRHLHLRWNSGRPRFGFSAAGLSLRFQEGSSTPSGGPRYVRECLLPSRGLSDTACQRQRPGGDLAVARLVGMMVRRLLHAYRGFIEEALHHPLAGNGFRQGGSATRSCTRWIPSRHSLQSREWPSRQIARSMEWTRPISCSAIRKPPIGNPQPRRSLTGGG